MSELMEQIGDAYGSALENATTDQLAELLGAVALSLEIRHRERESESRLIQSLSDEILQAPDSDLLNIVMATAVRMRLGSKAQLVSLLNPESRLVG